MLSTSWHLGMALGVEAASVGQAERVMKGVTSNPEFSIAVVEGVLTVDLHDQAKARKGKGHAEVFEKEEGSGGRGALFKVRSPRYIECVGLV